METLEDEVKAAAKSNMRAGTERRRQDVGAIDGEQRKARRDRRALLSTMELDALWGKK